MAMVYTSMVTDLSTNSPRFLISVVVLGGDSDLREDWEGGREEGREEEGGGGGRGGGRREGEREGGRKGGGEESTVTCQTC